MGGYGDGDPRFNETCPICLWPMGEALVDPFGEAVELQWYPCSHWMHKNCAMSMCAAYGAPLDDIPCPVCRIVPDQAQNMVDRIDRIPDTAIEIEDDGSESKPESEVSVSVRAAIRERQPWPSGTLRESASTLSLIHI